MSGTIIWMAVSISVFTTPHADGTRAMSIVPVQTFQSYEDCDKWRVQQSEVERTGYDQITNKAVDAYLFDCTPITPDLMTAMLQNPA